MRGPALNYQGSDWSLFEEWLEGELMDCYKALANPATSEAETERLRGRAQFISLLLGFKNTELLGVQPLA